MFYHDEIREFPISLKGEQASPAELKLAAQLIESISSAAFAAEDYHDEYRQRVLELIEEKSKGKTVKLHPKAPQPVTEVVDLMQRLKDSLARTSEKRPMRSRALATSRSAQPAGKKSQAGRR